ncbi:helix-turn-helix domain-containing protein [Rhodovarius lipocyclicus]|uniref:helix-turn-helix domain-containing protein n=1 Tax=Rhodovarius lipocyclicus TaxID=268410 RepID=UPI00135B8178|nr:helix-turn-helix transcriptional regulator [Rhodovarius lipocyclicus]
MKFADVGQRLRAYRLESGMRAEEIAARLGVSRAALYRYEKGEVIKLETIRRLAELLKISPLSLLGIGVEYFTRPTAFGERLRNLEEQADQILQVGGRLCQPLTTDAFDGALVEAWTESAEKAPDRAMALTAIEQAVQSLSQRKRNYNTRRPNMTVVLAESTLRRFLEDGVAGSLVIPERTRARCRVAALAEAASIAQLMESLPIGLQIGLAQGVEPSGNFRILRGRERAFVATSPFPVDSLPWVSTGVTSITSADDAVAAHQRVAEAVWRDALKGSAAAERVRELIREAEAG